MESSNTRDRKVNGCQSKLCVILKQLLFLYKFYDFFCRWHSLMNRHIVQIMQHDNIRNLTSVFFIQWKHLDPRVNAFWYCFKVIKRYTFPCLIKSIPITGNLMMIMMMIMMMMMNYFVVWLTDERALSLISRRDHFHRSSPSRISDTSQAGFGLAQNLSSEFVEWRCAVVITARGLLKYLIVWFMGLSKLSDITF